MTAAIVEHDNDRLEDVLEEMQQTLRIQDARDGELLAAREVLAKAFSCAARKMTLSSLMESLPAGRQSELDERRRRIGLLAGQLRNRHQHAAWVVVESARINRMLLDRLFPDAGAVTVYEPGGRNQWRTGPGLVDAEM
jgi:flagellar biosynthesis/type III secretory pathway chaperone